MFRIDDSSAAASRPAPAVAGTPGFFTDGDPTTATPPTTVPADWLNQIQEELYGLLVAAGITPSKTNLAQVLAAIRILCWTPLNDGSGSGLDADLLDGQNGSYYAAIAARLGYTPANKAGDNFTGAITRASNTIWDAGNDGSGSGLDADLLDGHDSAEFVRVTSSDTSVTGHRTYADGIKEAWGSVTVAAGASVVITVPGTYSTWFIVKLGAFVRNTSEAQFNTGMISKSLAAGVATFTLQNWEDVDLEVDWETRGL